MAIWLPLFNTINLVGGLEHEFNLSIYWEFQKIPTDFHSMIFRGVALKTNQFTIINPIGSMYAIYGNMDPINILPMLAYIPAPWILWELSLYSYSLRGGRRIGPGGTSSYFNGRLAEGGTCGPST